MFDIERFMDGQWVAYGRGRSGCYASSRTQAGCQAAVAAAAAGYETWLRGHDLAPLHTSVPGSAEVGEVLHAWEWGEPPYEVNAFFAADQPVLSAPEITHGLRLLAATRADLVAALDGLTPDHIAQEVEDGWSIATILRHIANAENWYLSHLGLALDRDALPDDPLERLSAVRLNTEAVLPTLAGDDRLAVISYEIWSPRKVLRRDVWHERDHTEHVLQFRQRLGA